jgi:DNA-binding NtrC family response regulator
MHGPARDPIPPEVQNAQPVRWPGAAVLVVDDEPGMCNFLLKALGQQVARVEACGSAEEATVLMQRQHFDLLVLDITLPGQTGLALLQQLRAEGDAREVVLISAYADLDTAIEALRAGAGDLLLKPFRITQALNAVHQGLERVRLKRENRLLRRALSTHRPTADGLVGSSIAIKGLQAALQRVAAVDSTVLLSGESGTGKELAALSLHRLSARASGPFVAVNCATTDAAALELELFGHVATPGQPAREGLLSAARGGTLFLDQVAELPVPLQATLLRVLETGIVRPLGGEQGLDLEARIVAASSRVLSDELAAGRFRADLYYRLAVVEIRLPPLRAHREDIPELVAHFVGTQAPRLGVEAIEVTADEMAFLQGHRWPGNVRELRNLIERSLIVGALNLSALQMAETRPPAPATPQPGGTAPVDLQTLERRHIQAVLRSVGGDKTRAAGLLGISRRTLERRVAEWDGAEAG